MHSDLTANDGRWHRSKWAVSRLAFVLAALVSAVLAASGVAPVSLGAATLLIVSILMLIIAYRCTRDIFHPWVFTNGYLNYVLLAPILYMQSTGSEIGRIPLSSLSGIAPTVMVLCAGGWTIGTLLATSPIAQRPSSAPTEWRVGRVASLGTLVLSISLLMTMVLYVLTSGETYGANQGVYTGVSALSTLSEGLLPVGVLLSCAGSERRFLLSSSQWLILLSTMGISLLGLSSRSAVLTPALLLAWYATRRKQIRPLKALVAVVAVVAVFNWVGNVRAGSGEVVQTASNPWARSLVDTSSPYQVTDILGQLVPDIHPYYEGSTYVAAIASFAPGILTQDSNDQRTTASLEFRRLTGVGSGQGLGFSLPSEAYMNFGLSGVILISMAVSLIGSSFYNRSLKGIPTDVKGYVYPVFMASMVYGIRSDSLGQIKSIGYPLLIAAISLAVMKRRLSKVRQ
ncbi:O-antigen polysaccharide polymerase Wzy [Terrabacter sp. NPDC080008]|uniref:O-antigen polysaccharide polymerase Wzy n=1 Tax=Terrabacter sp. NPDC080008 TaxID=3155176 RepID=UPI00344D862B